MTFTFLGTGTSQGVPIIGCRCRVCLSNHEKDKRLRSSLLIESETTTIVIDSGPDFRQQLLRADVRKLDALVFTHAHKDHLAGMDDIRAFNYLQGKPVDIYATEETQSTIRTEFSYIFDRSDYPGVPQVKLHTITKHASFQIGDIECIPIEVYHYQMPVLGFRIGDFTYITDANFIDDIELQKVLGSNFLVLNALRREAHISHFTLEQAIALANRVGAQQTYFTHISHQLGLYDEIEAELPPRMNLAFDSLSIVI
ncbi:MAG: MBL fold metallo-hydrolase [Bacteroidetes bacterium]|nr:MBL fold metallo-hydrolase [Bacteroidota bacterium]